jgi:hypothetical protein
MENPKLQEQNVGADDRTKVVNDSDHMILRAVMTIHWYYKHECPEYVKTNALNKLNCFHMGFVSHQLHKNGSISIHDY